MPRKRSCIREPHSPQRRKPPTASPVLTRNSSAHLLRRRLAVRHLSPALWWGGFPVGTGVDARPTVLQAVRPDTRWPSPQLWARWRARGYRGRPTESPVDCVRAPRHDQGYLAPRPGAQTQYCSAVCRARRHAVRTRCPLCVVHEDSQRCRALISLTYKVRARSPYAPLTMRAYTWCRMNVRHVGDGKRGWRAIYFAAVVRERQTPSFASSPWRRGAPQSLFSWLMRRISVRVSAASAGRPGRCRRRCDAR
jgi:hypothetical protein